MNEKMKIAFDAKRITHNATGLGNYGRTIVGMLARFAPGGRYLLYTPDPGREELRGRLPESDVIRYCYNPNCSPSFSNWYRYNSLLRYNRLHD